MSNYPASNALPIPLGRKATKWFRWVDIVSIAHLLGVNKNYTMSENFAVKALLDAMVAKGEAQVLKLGPYQQSPAFYRLIY